MLAELRRLEMHVAVDAAGRRNQAFGVAYRGRHAAHQFRVHAIHHLRVACLADGDNLAVLDAKVAFDDAENGIDDRRVADQHVERALRGGMAGLQAHAVAQRFAAPVQALVARHRVVVLDLRKEGGIAETNGVAFGGAVHCGVFFAGHSGHCLFLSVTSDSDWVEGSMRSCPLVARRATRLDEGKSTRTVRVPWQGTLCVPCPVEFRSRLVESGSAGTPLTRGATPGAAFFWLLFLAAQEK